MWEHESEWLVVGGWGLGEAWVRGGQKVACSGVPYRADPPTMQRRKHVEVVRKFSVPTPCQGNASHGKEVSQRDKLSLFPQSEASLRGTFSAMRCAWG